MKKYIIVLLALLLPASSALGQDQAEVDDVFDRGCGDDNGTDRCDLEIQQRMRAQYGLEDAATLLRRGTSLRRAMIVNGYGRDIVVVSFNRAPGQAPQIGISSPKDGYIAEGGPLQAAINQAVWNRVLTASKHFDEKLSSEVQREKQSQDPDAPISLCLHGWFAVVEAIDAAEPHVSRSTVHSPDGKVTRQSDLTEMPGRIRSDAENACDEGLAMPFAFLLADIAAEELAECSTLDRSKFRNSATLLATCHRLGGDRLAAGEAMAVTDAIQRAPEDLVVDDLQFLFTGFGKEKAEAFISGISGADMSLGEPYAQSQNRATITGDLTYPIDGSDTRFEIAEITLLLIRNSDDFKIHSFEIAERKPFEFDD